MSANLVEQRVELAVSQCGQRQARVALTCCPRGQRQRCRCGRISRAEYANCWYGGGFYNTYNRSQWETSYGVFDTNRDGYLSAEEYWGTSAYSAYDRNRDGVIDSSEWPW